MPPMRAASETWERELGLDPDRKYILERVREGFKIVDTPELPPPVCVANYKSTKLNRAKVEETIREEVAAGNYVLSTSEPRIVSSLGAIPKPQSDNIRLIHDLTRGGVNATATDTSVKYPSLEDATQLMKPGAFISKIDLRHAYRCVSIHPSCYALTGLQWLFYGSSATSFLHDTRLPFGAAKSCHIFQRLSNAVVRMMARRGHSCLGYLDDFIVVADTEGECLTAFSTLKQLLVSLGFTINVAKTVEPCQELTFLGIEINTVARSLSLPPSS